MVTARRATVHALRAIGTTAAAALGALAMAAVGSGAAVAAPAADVPARVSPSPSASPSTYVPLDEPTLVTEIFEPICDGDVPYLRYRVVATGIDVDTVTITWINPTGDDVVQADLPLDGRVLWPGAVVAADGSPLDWPGWRLEDGEWVVGDEFDWVRPSVDVRFEANPELTKTAAYPPSSPSCATNPPGSPEPTIEDATLTPLCEAGVAYLDYALRTTGPTARTATLTWHNPGGEDVVMSGQPLSGRVLWPGTYPERFVDLPASEGWELVNDIWQNTRDFGWAVGTVDVTVSVDPEVTVPVTFPQDTRDCVTSATPVSRFLPRTGAGVATAASVAVGLVALGGAMVAAVRRRRAGE